MSLDQPNPYDSPTVPVSNIIEDVNPVLATRLARLCAALIDYVLLGVCVVGAIIAGIYFQFLSIAEQSFIPTLFLLTSHLAINGYLLAANGQTVGKMILGLRIVDFKTGRKLPFYRVFFLRSLWAFLLLLVPFNPLTNFLFIADAAMILLLQQRCLHDWFAGSTVVSIHSSQSN